jgi:hypothetical protein
MPSDSQRNGLRAGTELKKKTKRGQARGGWACPLRDAGGVSRYLAMAMSTRSVVFTRASNLSRCDSLGTR